MRPRTTLTLLMMACLLAGLVWLLQDRNPRAGDSRPVAPPPEKVTSLAIAGQALQVQCEKTGNDWFIVKPLRARADARAVDRVLQAVAEMPLNETITAEQMRRRGLTLHDYGVGEKPRAELTVRSAQTNLSVLIGRDTLDDVLYVRYPPADTVVATSTGILAVLPKGMDELRDRKLIRGEAADVTRVEIARLSAGFVQAVRKDGQWTMQQPVKGAKLNGQKLLRMLKTLADNRVERFLDDSDAQKAGLDESRAAVQIAVWSGDETEGQKLIIGGEVPGHVGEVYAKSPDSELPYTVRKEILDAFNVAAGALRDPAVFQIPPDAIVFIRLRDGERRLEFTRVDGEWQIVEPRRLKADSAVMNALLARMSGLKVEEFIDAADPIPPVMGLATAARSIEVSTDLPDTAPGEAKAEKTRTGVRKTLLIGSDTADGQRVHVRFQDETSVLLLLSETVREITEARFAAAAASFGPSTNAAGTAGAPWVNPLLYCNRMMLQLERGAIGSISVTKLTQEQTICRDETGSWRPVPPLTGNVKGNVVTEMLDAVVAIEASRIECQGVDNLASYGLDEPAARVTLGMVEGKGIRKTLLLGFRAGSDGVYAMIQGQDMVFVLPKKLVGGMLRDLVSEGAHEG